MIKFKDTYNKEIDRLKQFIPIVSRVHGKTHSEFYEVEEIFNEITKKVESNNFNLNNEFNKLRQITSNYKIPNDTCETYEYVYNKLNILNESFGD